MKIIGIWENYGAGEPWTAGQLPCFWATDSCLLRESRPLYLPDFDNRYTLAASLALRIDRLGKGMPARFTRRYWAEASLWLNLRPEGVLQRLQSRGLPLGSALSYDCSIVASPFTPLTEEDVPHTHYIIENGAEQMEWRGERLRMDVAHTLENVARYTTLKTGDIILIGLTPTGLPVEQDQTITINRADRPLHINRFSIK